MAETKLSYIDDSGRFVNTKKSAIETLYLKIEPSVMARPHSEPIKTLSITVQGWSAKGSFEYHFQEILHRDDFVSEFDQVMNAAKRAVIDLDKANQLEAEST